MADRSYEQFCGLAAALDLAGERWTLLLVRELMTGSKRYTDLQDNLPGIGTSLLSSRLKRLEQHGIIAKQKLQPPAASVVYRLTDAGEELARALVPLIRWGLRHALVEEPTPAMSVRPEWSLLGITYDTSANTLAGIEATYEFRIGGASAYLRIRDGVARTVSIDEAGSVDAVVTLDPSTVAAVGAGRLSAVDAVANGRIQLEGSDAAIASLVGIFADDSAAS